jgi:hypothetical protein
MNDFKLKKGRIEITKSTIPYSGNAHSVRILPDMDGMPGIPIDLPRYGNFFQEVPRLYANGDIVWVLCTEDYQVGYILGPAERFGGTPINTLIARINEAEEKFELPKSDIRSADIFMATDQFIDYTNKTYGYVGRITISGALTLFTGDGSIFIYSKGAVLKLLASGESQQTATSLTQTVEGPVKEKSSSHFLETQGYVEEISGSKKEKVGVSLSRSIGGDAAKTVIGNEENLCFQNKKERAGLGYTIQVILPLGNIDLTSLLGGINLNSIFLNAPLGFASPAKGPGPFCTLPICLFAGVPHTGRTFTGVPLP